MSIIYIFYKFTKFCTKLQSNYASIKKNQAIIMYHDQYYNRDVTKMQLPSKIRKSLTKLKVSRDTRVMNRATGGGEVIYLVP